MATTFTNRPELIGQPGYTDISTVGRDPRSNMAEIAPGVKYSPSKGWSLEAMVRAFPDSFKIDPETAAAIDRDEIDKERKSQARPEAKGTDVQSDYAELAAKYGKPPEGWNIPDYSADGRKAFEQFVFKQVGGNPHTFDPNEEVNKSSSYLPTLFNQVFQGQVRYEDRHTMSKKQKDHWEKERNGFRAWVQRDAEATKNKMMQEYQWIMGDFDRRAKEFKAARDALDKKINRRIDAFNPKTRIRRQVTVDEFNQLQAEDPNWTRGTPMDKGAQDDGVSVIDLKRLYDVEEDAFNEDNLVDGRVPETKLRAINRMRESLDLPLVDEIVGEEPEWGGLRIWWNETMPGIIGGGGDVSPTEKTYQYKERTGGTKKTDTGAATKPTAVDPSGNPYPEGHTGTYQGRPVVVQNGQWVFQ